MTIKELYANVSGNYDEALGRLMNDVLIKKFSLKFLNDGSYNDVKAALEAGDTETAFRAAHTLKGVSSNLAYTKLANSSSELTELLRAGDLAAAKALFPTVQADYELTVGEIKKL